MNVALLALAFIKQLIFFIGGYIFLRLLYYPKKVMEVITFDRPVGTVRLIIFLHFVVGTWFRYQTQMSLFGIFGDIFGIKF